MKQAQPPADEPAEVMAAVDLGSNSFHMVVARAQHGQPSIVDRLRETVRLGSGLDKHDRLDDESQERALACLRRFGQRLRDMRAHQVRVVGTNTLRRARNADAFLEAAEQALGHPVEVISGIEEARLIYLGVSHHTDTAEGANLVVDIGGGSTELIIGEGYEPKHLESLSIGCVGVSQEHFDDGRLTEKRFDRARLAVRLELQPVAAPFRRRGWKRAIGSSGTVRAARDIAQNLGLAATGVSLPAL
ncbi:MAG TPA: Ppx/GppA family phosphatase, partial [Gammaproteobacteria bacterium]|nr:Ppx/GppA family phosphatase [Gammaproteobacteria bacterium]